MFKSFWQSTLGLVLRLYIGYEWATAGWEKLTGKTPFDASGFIKGAIGKAGGQHPAVQGWWADFLKSFALPNIGLFNVLVPWGELLVGIALILGFVTTFAAIMGMVMNLAYLLSGTTSTNPNLLALEFLLVAVCGVYAGAYGLDRWVRPYIRARFRSEPAA